MAPTAPAALVAALVAARDDDPLQVSMSPHATRGQPLAGTVISVVLALVSASVLSGLFTMRANVIRSWRRLPYVVWILFFIYVDSYIFVFSSAIAQYGIGVNANTGMCDAAILICLVFYVTTKAVYLFLVEKAYIIRGTRKPRMKSKLYLFNSFGMMGVYVAVVVLNFVFRIARIEDGTCIIGMQKLAMIPLISFDFLVNVYLTILFLIPLMGLYSFKVSKKSPRRQAPSAKLRTAAIRTFIGACCTLASSIVNLTVLMILNGEPGWVCLMCCNSDILFSALVLYWITSKDNAASGRYSFDSPSARRANCPDVAGHVHCYPDCRGPRRQATPRGSGGGGVVDTISALNGSRRRGVDQSHPAGATSGQADSQQTPQPTPLCFDRMGSTEELRGDVDTAGGKSGEVSDDNRSPSFSTFEEGGEKGSGTVVGVKSVDEDEELKRRASSLSGCGEGSSSSSDTVGDEEVERPERVVVKDRG